MSGPDEFPLSTSAYIADTQHLSLTQHGAYLLILMTMWRAGGWIDDDERKLATICKTSVAKWRKIATDIRALLIVQDGKLSQKRLQKEIGKALKTVSANRVNGSAGGKAKALKSKGATLATANNPPAHSPGGRHVAAESALTTLSLDSDSEVKKDKKVSRSGTALPSDWQPTDAERLYGRTVCRLTDQDIDAAAERMRRWAIANRHRAVARKSDWDITFRNWLDGDAAKNGASGHTTQSAKGGFAAMAVEIRKQMEAHNGPSFDLESLPTGGHARVLEGPPRADKRRA